MVKENIRIFAISINKQESDLSYSQESESEVQTTDSPVLVFRCANFLISGGTFKEIKTL